MKFGHLDATDHPDLAARDLLLQFNGDLARVESHIAINHLAEALRSDDYESYLHWRTVGNLCIELAAAPSRPAVATSTTADRAVLRA